MKVIRLEPTLVLTICNRLGLADGLSPALTSATRDVQNNISTIAVAPSSVLVYFSEGWRSVFHRARDPGESTKEDGKV